MAGKIERLIVEGQDDAVDGETVLIVSREERARSRAGLSFTKRPGREG